jgi:hypothetical protein
MLKTMIIRKILLLTAILHLLVLNASAQSFEEAGKKGMAGITENVLKAQLTFLASDWMEGRETGEKGEYMSADYIASMLQLYGARPGGDFASGQAAQVRGTARPRTYYQNFQLLKSSPGTEQKMSLVTSGGTGSGTVRFVWNVDYTFRNSATGLELDAPVVFVGYGVRSEKFKYDDFAKKDVKGKIILRLSGVPPVLRDLAGAEANAIAAGRDNTARELGAVGILEVTPGITVLPSGIEPRDFLNMSPSEGRPRSGAPQASLSIPQKVLAPLLPRITLSERAANEILREAGFTVSDFTEGGRSGSKPQYPEVVGKRIHLVSSVNSSLINVRNVIGVIEGENLNEVIVVGAHYDHTGMGNGYVWNGADDNGSGTVAVLTLAKAVMESGVKPKKTIIFALWTAEEKGLLGSRYWVDNPTVPLENVKMHINFDMISRYIADETPNAVTMTYTSSHPLFREITEKNMVRYGIKLEPDYQPSDNPPGGSDHRSFVAKGIPIMRFKPGHREEYHTPADELSTIDWDIMEKVVKISFANLWDLATTDWK